MSEINIATAETAHVLVVDDDERLRRLLRRYLADNGFMVSVAVDAADARRKLALFAFDCIVLDIMMPGESGLALAASLDKAIMPPILMLSALGEPENRIAGLEAGVDDYLSKPFEPRELVLRIRTILRRVEEKQRRARTVRFGRYVFDIGSSTLYHEGTPVYLTASEASLLRVLAENAGTAVSREDMARAASANGEKAADGRGVDVQITRLRKKIESAEGRPVYIQTVRGAGYVLWTE